MSNTTKANALDYETITSVRWSSTRGEDRFTVESPATGQIITTVQGSGATEVDAAIHAADIAFHGDWRWTSPQQRSILLSKCADVLEAHADELAAIETHENGKPLADGRLHDVGFLIGVFRFFAGIVDKTPSEFYDKGAIYTSVVLEPLGVVGAIIPFNWPPIHTGGKVAAALAVGNTVVVKPSEQAPLTIMRIIELCNTVLPPDVLHVVPGGPAAGMALTANPVVKKITFTGSTRAGIEVAKAAAVNVTPVTLELGGKNAFVVFEDADLDQAVRDALDGGFYNKGEACTAASRVLVHRSIHDEFVRRLSAGVRALTVGDGTDPATAVGPSVTRAQQQRVLDYIQIGQDEGATIAAQAPLPTDPRLRDGFWIPPTLFSNVTRTMRIAIEEIFGPVQTVTIFDTEDEAVEIVNESEFGLMCGIYSLNQQKAFRVARRVEAGMILINNYNRAILGTPFGGLKHSGYGREHTQSTLQEFGSPKMMRFPSGIGTIPTWRSVVDVYGPEGANAGAAVTR
jgi:acyl-CoA reductase-like NAD-dependent aldehyde dehydrogenase